MALAPSSISSICIQVSPDSLCLQKWSRCKFGPHVAFYCVTSSEVLGASCNSFIVIMAWPCGQHLDPWVCVMIFLGLFLFMDPLATSLYRDWPPHTHLSAWIWFLPTLLKTLSCFCWSIPPNNSLIWSICQVLRGISMGFPSITISFHMKGLCVQGRTYPR